MRHIWIVRSKVLYILAGMVITLAIGLQAYASWTRWHVARINANAVACRLPIDFGQAIAQEITFVPFCSRQYKAYLTLRMPLPEGWLKHLRSREFEPLDSIQQALQKNSFRIAWRLLQKEKVIASQTVTKDDLRERVYTTYVNYIFAARPVSLKAGTSYRLVLAVEQAARPLNEFEPALIIRTGATLKGQPIAGWRITDAALMASIGGALVVMAVWKRRFESKSRREAADSLGEVGS